MHAHPTLDNDIECIARIPLFKNSFAGLESNLLKPISHLDQNVIWRLGEEIYCPQNGAFSREVSMALPLRFA